MRYTFTVTIWTNGLFYLLPVSVKALSNYMIVSVHQMLKTKTIKSLFFSLFFSLQSTQSGKDVIFDYGMLPFGIPLWTKDC